MPIEITIIKSPGNVNVIKPNHSFSEEGGTLGRGANNAWVLDDPEKYMSSIHTQIGYENGQYILVDTSTNGTFLNGSEEPLGNGNKVNLHEGDRFAISDYEFAVKIVGGNNDNLFSQPAADGPFAMGGADNNPIESYAADPFSENDPFGSPMNQPAPLAEAISGFDDAETDPLAVLDKANSNRSSPFEANQTPDLGFGDTGNIASGAIAWPNANIETGMIPDDWDNEDLMSSEPVANPQPFIDGTAADSTAAMAPVNPRHPVNSAPQVAKPVDEYLNQPPEASATVLKSEYLALEDENKQLMSDIVKLKLSLKKLKTQGDSKKPTGKSVPQRSKTSQDQTLIESMGLSKWNLDDEKIIQISDTVGLMVRETMEGMMRVLKFRKKIKEEFRINVTTIQPIENNPLKFSANVDDAMENMFIKENNAYKEPISALREGFQGVAEHQVAVLAGMQAAFRGMLDRLDPVSLEKRFEKYKKSGLISLGQKGKNWESYKEYHKGLIDNLDDSFQHLFGYDFVQAYEDQMQRLVSNRLSKKNQ